MRQCPCAHKQKRRHFHAKTARANLYVYIWLGARDLYIDRAHTALDIFRFIFFFLLFLSLDKKILTPTHSCLIKFLKKCHKGRIVQVLYATLSWACFFFVCACFVNIQVPCPHSITYVKFCTSRLCMKMSYFLFVRAWAMPRILYLSCGVPFPVWTPDNISGLISVVPWLLRWEVIKKKFR